MTNTPIEVVTGGAAMVGLPRIPRVSVGLPNNGKAAGLWVGNGVPTDVAGAVRQDEYLDNTNGDVYTLGGTLSNPVWTKTGNIRGPAGPSGDTTLNEQELQALVDRAAAEAAEELEPPIDLTVLYTNAKI